MINRHSPLSYTNYQLIEAFRSKRGRKPDTR